MSEVFETRQLLGRKITTLRDRPPRACLANPVVARRAMLNARAADGRAVMKRLVPVEPFKAGRKTRRLRKHRWVDA